MFLFERLLKKYEDFTIPLRKGASHSAHPTIAVSHPYSPIRFPRHPNWMYYLFQTIQAMDFSPYPKN